MYSKQVDYTAWNTVSHKAMRLTGFEVFNYFSKRSNWAVLSHI